MRVQGRFRGAFPEHHFHPFKEVFEVETLSLSRKFFLNFHPFKEVFEAIASTSDSDNTINFHPFKEVFEASPSIFCASVSFDFHPFKEVFEGIGKALSTWWRRNNLCERRPAPGGRSQLPGCRPMPHRSMP